MHGAERAAFCPFSTPPRLTGVSKVACQPSGRIGTRTITHREVKYGQGQGGQHGVVQKRQAAGYE